MERTDRAGLHWQPLAATEREALAAQVDQVLAAQVPVRPDEPTHHAGDCPGGDDCPKCGWEAVPS